MFFLKMIISYSLLILLKKILQFLNFFTIDKNLIKIGQEILLERIPHHANIYYWLTYKETDQKLSDSIEVDLLQS